MSALLRQVRRFPWITNVTLYGCLFASGDLVHQWFSRREELDLSHTRNVAVVAFSFHGNFNFFWMRFLERRFPGNSGGMVLRKLFLDQTTAAPLATTVFYTGVSFLEGKEDILEDWNDKFLNTYKTGLMFWPFMQFLNFSLVPLYIRTTFTGCCGFVWATFLCFSRQSGDGTAAAALSWILAPRQQDSPEPSLEQRAGLVEPATSRGGEPGSSQKQRVGLVEENQAPKGGELRGSEPGSSQEQSPEATRHKMESQASKTETTIAMQETTNPTEVTQKVNGKQEVVPEVSLGKGAQSDTTPTQETETSADPK